MSRGITLDQPLHSQEDLSGPEAHLHVIIMNRTCGTSVGATLKIKQHLGVFTAMGQGVLTAKKGVYSATVATI